MGGGGWGHWEPPMDMHKPYNSPGTVSVFEPGRDLRDMARFLFQCRAYINHLRHHVATKY